MQCKSCFFIGHREAGPEILPALEAAIEKHISEYGVTEFIVGHYGGLLTSCIDIKKVPL